MVDMSTLSNIADEADDLAKKIEEGEEETRKLKKKYVYLTEDQLPEIMKELDLEKITTSSGLELSLTSKALCNNSKERKPGIHAWLRENGQGAAIERVIMVPFGLGEEEADAADIVKAALGDIKREFLDDENVNTARLNALVNRLMEEGVDVPLEEIFGAFIKDKVKIKRKKD